MLGSAAQAGAAGCGAWPPSAPATRARLSLCPTAGKLPPRQFKNKHLGLLGGLPCKNKYGISASPPGAGAHKRSLGAPLHPPGLRHTSHPTRGARRLGGCQIPPLTPAPAAFSAGSQEENRACKPNSSRGSSSPPAREWETNSPMHRISKSSLLFPAILPKPIFFFPLGRNKPSLQQGPLLPPCREPCASRGPVEQRGPLPAVGASPRSCAQQEALTPCCRASAELSVMLPWPA